MKALTFVIALLLSCTAALADKKSTALLFWPIVPSTEWEAGKVGEVTISLRPVPPEKKNDAPQMAVFIGDKRVSKTPIYPGKRYDIAVLGTEGKSQCFINGYADGKAIDEPLDGVMVEINPHDAKITGTMHTAKEIFEFTKDELENKPRPVTVGHRGDNRFAPENTNISYVQAIEKHCPIVEMDLRLTKDNALVLLHDPTVDRTTNGKGKILDIDYADAKKLDAGTWKDAKFKGEPIPLVADVAKTCNGKAIMMLDLKCTGLGESIAAMKKETNFPADQMILAPWEDDEGTALRKYIPDVPMIRLTSKIPTENFDDAYFSKMQQIGFSGFSVNFQYLTAAFIESAHKHHFKIYTWTLNDEAEVVGAAINGVDGIITDDPANTARLLSELRTGGK